MKENVEAVLQALGQEPDPQQQQEAEALQVGGGGCVRPFA